MNYELWVNENEREVKWIHGDKITFQNAVGEVYTELSELSEIIVYISTVLQVWG